MTGEQASRAFSLLRVAVWIVLIPLAKVTGWIDSVAFVALCSLYANAASDYAAFRADSNARLERIEKQLDAIFSTVDDLARAA